MDILTEVYYKRIAENDNNLRFWDNYLQNLKSLDFNTFTEKLKVPALVPIGSRILFRGELRHTNEVTVALGADYFVKCSLKQADILRQHRIKGAQEKVDMFIKEKEYLQNQMSFTKQNINENEGQEIIEYNTEEEDKAWREKHKINVREYMQKRRKEKQIEKPNNHMIDEELWDRLEELELQEELEEELNSIGSDSTSVSKIKEIKKDLVVIKEEANIKLNELESKNNYEIKDKVKAEKEIKNKNVTVKETKAQQQSSKFDLLQQVIDRQNELDEKLQDLKSRERSQSKTERDIMAKLDELEQLEELEDELDRLDEIIDEEEVSEEEETEEGETDEEDLSKSDTFKSKRHVSFNDEDDSETLDLTFKHSETDINNEPYDPDKGIQKPSDIYKAHSNLFENETTSILKKSKYATNDELLEMLTRESEIEVEKQAKYNDEQTVQDHNNVHVPHQSIVIRDVVEKVGKENDKFQTETKPMSLFKKKRMQNKS